MSSDEDSDDGIKHLLKLKLQSSFQAPKGNRIRFILFFCNFYSNIRTFLYDRERSRSIHGVTKDLNM